MSDPREGTVQFGSRTLVYIDYGGAGGVPLVLVHGYTAFAHEADNIAPAFAAGRRTVALGLAGHGDSSPLAEPYSLDGFVEDVTRQIDHLGLERFDLLGRSMGGAIAISYAAQNPERIRRLVIEEGAPVDEKVFGSGQRPDVPHRFSSVAEAELYLRKAYDGFPDEFISNRLRFALRPEADGGLVWRHDQANLPSAFDSVRMPQFGAPLWAHVAAIASPTLVLRAGPSTVFPRETAVRMAAINPRLRIVEMSAATHWVQVSHRAIFLRIVLGHLDRPQSVAV